MGTMAWMMDPSYMISHPWFWGVEDNSLMSTWMMFEIMSDRDRYATADRNLFIGESNYAPDRFSQPILPHFYQSNDTPVVHPWDEQPQGVTRIVPSFDGESVTWGEALSNALSGATTQETASNSIWNLFSGGSTNSDSNVDTTPVSSSDSSWSSSIADVASDLLNAASSIADAFGGGGGGGGSSDSGGGSSDSGGYSSGGDSTGGDS